MKGSLRINAAIALCSFFATWPGLLLAQVPAETSAIPTTIAAQQSLIADTTTDPETSTFAPNSGRYESDNGETIDTFTGALRFNYVDIDWPGTGGLNMRVVRTYNGFKTLRKGFTNEFGLGWSINTMRLIKTSQKIYHRQHKKSSEYVEGYVLQMPDGNFKRFVHVDLGIKSQHETYLSQDNWRLVLTGDDVIATVNAPNGMQYQLQRDLVGVLVGKTQTNEWTLIQEKDLYGNNIDYQYESMRGAYRLTNMKANDGREIKFNYDRIHHEIILTSIQAGDKVWQYKIDRGELQHSKGMVPLLHLVKRPDGLSTRYFYHCYKRGCQVKTIIHPTGGRTTYDYKTFENNADLKVIAGKTLWKSLSDNDPSFTAPPHKPHKRTPGRGKPRPGQQLPQFEKVGHWQFDFPDWNSKTQPCGLFQCTTASVVGPHHRTEYQHAVVGHNTDYMSDRGRVWQHGLLVNQKTFANPQGTGQPIEQSQLDWQSQTFSDQKRVYDRYIFDNQSNRPLLMKKTVHRDGTEYATHYSQFDRFGQPGTIIQSGPDGKLEHRFIYRTDWQRWLIDLPVEKNTIGVGKTQFEYHPQGKLKSHNQFGAMTQWDYDQSGQLQRKTDPLGRRWQYSEYHRGVAQSITQPDGVRLRQVVDNFGRVIIHFDGLGHQTKTTYDKMNRPTIVTPAQGVPSQITYNEYAPGSETVRRGDYEMRTQVNSLGMKQRVTVLDSKQGNGYQQSFLYDESGRQIFASFLLELDSTENVSGVYHHYDPLNRVVETGTQIQDKKSQVNHINYLPNRSVQHTNPQGGKTLSRYRAISIDGPNLMLSQTDANNVKTTIRRNLHGDMTMVVRGDFTQHYAYNSQYHLLRHSTPEIGVVEYTRDLIGRMQTKKIADNAAAHYVYDALDRLTEINYGDGLTIKQRYDANGNLLGADNGHSAWQYQYDKRNQRNKSTLVSGQQSWALHYSYDAMGNLLGMTYPNGLHVAYKADALGRYAQVGDVIKSINYTAFGQKQQIKLGNGVDVQFYYDPHQRISGQTVKHRNGDLSLAYAYEQRGLLNRIDDSRSPTNAIQLGYDAVGQLIKADGPWGQGRVTYDVLGNILQKQMGEQNLTYQYDRQNRLLRTTGEQSFNFFYDSLGNVTDDGDVRYRYNHAGELTQITHIDELSLQYDTNHHRLFADTQAGRVFTLHDEQHHLLYEVDVNGHEKSHIYLDGKRIATKSKDITHYYHHDHLGSVIATSDARGAVISHHQYYPFGAVFQGAPETALFSGKSTLPGVQLQDFSQRYYHPVLGRFLNVDPITFKEASPLSFNAYVYANNNPYLYIDPNGQFSVPNFLRDMFEGFVFGLSWGGESNEEHATTLSFYVGAGMGSAVNISGIGSAIKGLGAGSRGSKYLAERLIKKKSKPAPIWAKSKKHNSVEQAYKHWQKHQSEFPELNNAKEYVEMARSIWRARNQQMSTKMRGNGDVLFYDMESNTFTVFTADGLPKTMFRPASGAKYWGGQP